ncbi:MAG: PrsW family glutamic-type intramembrane protease [Nannocystaceae bacterium]
MTAVLALSTVLPSLLLLAYFRSRDVYPEPARVIWATFGLGVLTVIPVLAFSLPLSSLLAELESPFTKAAYEAFVLAAIPEETCKLLVLLLYARRHSAFDEPMDGLVYGVAASLGFATMENVLYVAQGGMGVAIMRAMTSIPGHATFGAIMGYFVGQAAFSPGRARAARISAFVWPVVLHGLYDFPLLAAGMADGTADAEVASAAMVAVPVILFAAIAASLRMSRQLRAAQLAGEALRSGLPPEAPAPRRSVWGVLAVIVGGLVATAGALMAAALVVAIATDSVAADERSSAFLAIGLFGAAPLLLGLVLFRLGIRRLNARR